MSKNFKKKETKKTVDFFYEKFCRYSSIYKQYSDNHTDIDFLSQLIGFTNYSYDGNVNKKVLEDMKLTVDHLLEKKFFEDLELKNGNLKLRMLLMLQLPFLKDLIDIKDASYNLLNQNQIKFNDETYRAFTFVEDETIRAYDLSQDYQKENYLKAFISFYETIIR